MTPLAHRRICGLLAARSRSSCHLTSRARAAFCAALVVSLLQGHERGEALARTCAAGAIAASRPGAQPSFPTAAELEEMLAR